MIHTLNSSQFLSTTLLEAWEFFSNPANLSKITPPELALSILEPPAEKIYPGMMIAYRVRPFPGIFTRWLTEITHVEQGSRFVDEQRIGPYRLWHHEHHFQELGPSKVEMRDRVTYAVPFGPLGELAHPFLVKPQLDRIFTYRAKAVQQLFG